MMKKATIELTKRNDLISVDVKCPQCDSKYAHGVATVTVPCKNCNITYKTDFNMNMFKKKAWEIFELVSDNDEVTIIADNDYYDAVLRFKENFIKQKAWKVSDIKSYHKDVRICLNCGTCLNCFTCQDCGTVNRTKGECKNCGSKKVYRTRFTKSIPAPDHKDRRACPECKSDNIRLTITDNKTQCHSCGSNKLSEPMLRTKRELVVTRRPAYYV